MMPVNFLDRRKDLDSQTCKDSCASLFRAVVYLIVVVFWSIYIVEYNCRMPQHAESSAHFSLCPPASFSSSPQSRATVIRYLTFEWAIMHACFKVPFYQPGTKKRCSDMVPCSVAAVNSSEYVVPYESIYDLTCPIYDFVLLEFS